MAMELPITRLLYPIVQLRENLSGIINTLYIRQNNLDMLSSSVSGSANITEALFLKHPIFLNLIGKAGNQESYFQRMVKTLSNYEGLTKGKQMLMWGGHLWKAGSCCYRMPWTFPVCFGIMDRAVNVAFLSFQFSIFFGDDGYYY